MAPLQVVEEGEDIEGEQLRNLIERIERLEEEKAVLADQVRSVYAEAKSGGFDPKIIRKVVRLRKMDPRDVDEEETLIHMYMRALGME
ncbi:MAG: DUF2312 domain-containing protein [Magnetococcales bacterium]|nr:DUF2312 domain-containing protein [Magnetococcales bacterium]MBF0114101.1 DUF2312 domain-containing protein [Magnetococcales bacterium]